MMDLLRVSTAGSVDDGKSTLLGRLLYDTKSIFEDQLESLEKLSRSLGEGQIDLALLTDGLRAEREQKITIDVAYRYFATPQRKFILADTPGHLQYTRNMITGASTAELAIILLDARKGVQTQSRRHGYIASLLQVPHLLVAVNKMDLVNFEAQVFHRLVQEYEEFAAKLQIRSLTFIPISALLGDNVVSSSANMPWYEGSTLLQHLETVQVDSQGHLGDFRFPVQYVVRPHQDFRGLAGQVYSGRVAPKDEVVVLPLGIHSTIKSVLNSEGELTEAVAGDSVILTLQDEIDVSRGDMIVSRMNRPTQSQDFEAMLCWMGELPLRPGQEFWLQHTTRRVKVKVGDLQYRVNVDSAEQDSSDSLEMNDIGRVRITSSRPLFFDPYHSSRSTGNFILIDPNSNNTVAAGMIREKSTNGHLPLQRVSPDVVPEDSGITLEERESLNGHRAAVLWFTGLSGSGKTAVARALERRLYETGHHSMLLDGDNLRHGLNGDLKFSPQDRSENVRRMAEVAVLGFQHGNLVLCSLISPFIQDREAARARLPQGRFLEIFVRCPLELCRQRDPKGLYQRALKGEIPEFTGVTSPYEEPQQADLVLDSQAQGVEELVEELWSYLREGGFLR